MCDEPHEDIWQSLNANLKRMLFTLRTILKNEKVKLRYSSEGILKKLKYWDNIFDSMGLYFATV